jgi:peroxiredoxin-like protein
MRPQGERESDMAELDFGVRLDWQGTSKDGEGVFSSGGSQMPYSAPAAMGGRGVGTNPEELLVGAVVSCYSITLANVLKAAGLPVSRLSVRGEGVVSDYPKSARFSRIHVHPTIAGTDQARGDEYRAAARSARDKCFIGRTVRDHLDYAVGDIAVVA